MGFPFSVEHKGSKSVSCGKPIIEHNDTKLRMVSVTDLSSYHETRARILAIETPLCCRVAPVPIAAQEVPADVVDMVWRRHDLGG